MESFIDTFYIGQTDDPTIPVTCSPAASFQILPFLLEVLKYPNAFCISFSCSFDALCAELWYGQKLGFSLDSLKDSNSKAKMEGVSPSTAASSSVVESVQKKTSSSTPAPSSQPGRNKRTQLRMRPRFAPDLDGVHCFESIVPS